MNARLVQKLIEEGTLRTPQIIAAFEAIDRADFVQPDQLEYAYSDQPLPIGYGVTISQPTTVAFMLELLQPTQGERILDVGAGSGWTAALLCYIISPGGSVTAVELIPQIVELGNRNLHKYYPMANIELTGDILGSPQKAPFDKILVSAASDEIPMELVAQLRIGGRMIIPVQETIVKVERISETEFTKEEYPGFMFVPLR